MEYKTAKQRAQFVQRVLEEHFPEPKIPLAHMDPYTLLIAVLLSAQSTDVRVNQVTPFLFAKAATPDAMVKLTPFAIEEIIRPCGLAPTKAKAIWQLSQDLLTRHEGMVPQSLEELELLPGVGHKTASVVMAQAFGQPAFPVDTHIFRSARRWGLSQGTNVSQVEKDLKRLFPKNSWRKLHLQIIYFARTYCPARAHGKKGAPPCPICAVLDQKIPS